MNLNQVTLPIFDMEKNAHFYRKMGFKQIVDTPHYARFECSTGDSTFSLHLVDKSTDNSGVMIYFECANLDIEVKKLKDRGIKFESDPTDQRWLWREARLCDPSGNRICLFNAGENRKFPPWRVERSDY